MVELAGKGHPARSETGFAEAETPHQQQAEADAAEAGQSLDRDEGAAPNLFARGPALLQSGPGHEHGHGEEHAPEAGGGRPDIGEAHEDAGKADAGGAGEQGEKHSQRGRCGPDGDRWGGHGVF